MPYADIIILALIAGFILLRLRNVLGQKTGEEADFLKKLKPLSDSTGSVIQLADKPVKNSEEPDTYLALISEQEVVKNIQSIKSRDPHFNATRFLDGAKAAFEMVHEAFAKGDKQTLSMLLSDALNKEFTAEIEARDKQDNKTETTLVSILSKNIIQAALTGNIATVTVNFTSEQLVVIRNPKGEIIGGDATNPNHVEDQWVFERDVTSRNPNWKIIET